MDINLSELLTQIAREKNVTMDLVIDALKTGLITAARKYINQPILIEAKIDKERNEISVYTTQKIVEIVNDPESEIPIDEAREIDPKAKLGKRIVEDLPVEKFGRAAIQTAKQIVIQKVREAERARIFEDYQDRVGELITGTVQQVDRGNIIVNLGRTEALIPWREQIKKEKYRQGDMIRALIINVEDSKNGAQVILSRTAPGFLSKLFELEVTEIYDGIVEIKAVSRDSGNRSKIAVISRDDRVDPVGACVGMKGNRVQAIVRELSNERIDIINWNEDLSVFVKRTLAPAEVKRVIEVADGRCVVVVNEESLAMAIGRNGQNIRLASALVGHNIDIFGNMEWDKKTEEEREEILKPKTVAVAEAEAGPDDASEEESVAPDAVKAETEQS
jgi:N utilization substance protein A